MSLVLGGLALGGLLSGLVSLGEARAEEPPLRREEAINFCVAELGRRIGTEAASVRRDHCSCVSDLALEQASPALRDPLARIVRRQPLSKANREALKGEAENFLLYVALVQSRCPAVLQDPMIQGLLKPQQ